MACMDFSFDSRIRKKYVPLINQQRYLRHVKRIAARNLFIPLKLLRTKLRTTSLDDVHDINDINDDNDDDYFDKTQLYLRLKIAFFYTISYQRIDDYNHQEQLLYRSELIMNNNPSWKGFDGSTLCSPSISQFIVRVYFIQMNQQTQTTENGTLFLEWKVNLTGLLYIGEEFPNDRRLRPNSIIFGFVEGFYTSVCSVASELLLTHSMPPTESLQIMDLDFTRYSYCLNTLIRIQMMQCIMQATAAQSKIEKLSLENELKKFHRKQELQTKIEKITTSIHFLKMIADRRRKRLQELQQEITSIEEKLCECNIDMSSNVQLLKQELSMLTELRTIRLPELVRKLSQIRSNLAHHRRKLARDFFSNIYTIVPFPDRNGYSINCVHLPSAQQMDQYQPKMLSIGLGYVAHLLYHLAIVLDIYLFHQILPMGSNSSILDVYNRLLPTINDRIVPLYPKSKSTLNIKYFKHGWYLLNRNLVFIRQSMGLVNTTDFATTLSNLYQLYRERFAYDNNDNCSNDCSIINVDDTLNRFDIYTPSSSIIDRKNSDNNVFDDTNEKLLHNINGVKINNIMIDSIWKEVEQMTIQSMKFDFHHSSNNKPTNKKQQQQQSSSSPSSTAMLSIVEEQIKDVIIKQRNENRQRNSKLLSQLSSSLSFQRATSSFDLLTPDSIRSSVISTSCSSPQDIIVHRQHQQQQMYYYGSSGSGTTNNAHLQSSSSSGSIIGHQNNSPSPSFRLINNGPHCTSSSFQQFHSIRKSQNHHQGQTIGPQSLPSINSSFLHPTTTTSSKLSRNNKHLPQTSFNLSLSLDNGLNNLNHRNKYHQQQQQQSSIQDDDDDDDITFLVDPNK